MFCDQCGKEIDEDSRFCRHCGAAQKQHVPDENIAPFGGSDRVAIEAPPVSAGSSTRPGRQWILWSLAVGALLLVILAILFATPSRPISGNIPDGSEANIADLDPIAENLTAADGAPAKDANWTYSADEDKVRNATTYFARTTSTNTVQQNPPYEAATTMTLTVRKHPEYGTDVVLMISSGQMMCSSYEGCSGTVRFDNGPAQRIHFNGTADGSSEAVFVVGAKTFIAQLKKSKTLVVEKTLFEAGNPQFEFDVADLKWDH